jgi:hypothetical protein
MESEALSQREAALASSHAAQQAELDALLAKQEERLKAWQEGCQELEAQLEARRKELGEEEDRWAAAAAANLGWGWRHAGGGPPLVTHTTLVLCIQAVLTPEVLRLVCGARCSALLSNVLCRLSSRYTKALQAAAAAAGALNLSVQ